MVRPSARTGSRASPAARSPGSSPASDLAHPGIVVRIDDGLDVELDLEVALGVPVAEVARQVDSAIRYAVKRSFDLEVRRLVIHVDGLRVQPGGAPPVVAAEDPTQIRTRDLADSGTDVA